MVTTVSEPVCSALLIFISVIIVAPVNSNYEDGACEQDWKCRQLSSCSLDLNDYETIFPCSQFGAPIRVCCPPTRYGEAAGSSTPASTTHTSTKRTSTTRKYKTKEKSTTKTPSTTVTTTRSPLPTSSFPVVSTASPWDDLPKSLQSKRPLIPDDCGSILVTDRIISGEDTELGEHPWMALVGYEEGGVKKFFCGATLISTRYVLTAAHCSKAANFTPSVVRLGEWNITSEKDCQLHQNKFEECSDPVKDIAIEKFTIHDSYGNRSLPLLQYDIALIRLATTVAFSDYIQPICLPVKPYTKAPYFTVAGWGVTDNLSRLQSAVLQFVIVSMFDFDECNSIAPPEVSPLLRGTQFCAGGKNGQDACKGDSGGPLTYAGEDNKIYQKGIVSLATSSSCGKEGRPTVFTEVTNFFEWILIHMET